MKFWGCGCLVILFLASLSVVYVSDAHGVQPLSRIAIHEATFDLHAQAYINASPRILGVEGQNSEWVTLKYSTSNPSADDWIGVFSPANFSAGICEPENPRVGPPYLCTAPIKFQFANYSSPNYTTTGNGILKLQLINQRSDFSFVLFSGGLSQPKAVSVSNSVTFASPKAPLYPRLAQGKEWNEMTVTWTSGYDINEASHSLSGI